MVRSDRGGNLLARIRPCPSASTMVTRLLPNPAKLNAFSIDACASAPTTTSSGGAPNIPSAVTSHPARARSAWRAVTSAVKFAMVAQVTKPPSHSGGNPSASQTQRRATSSNSAPMGDITRKAAFWFQAAASQLAARAAGTIPPFTKPK